MFGHLVISVDEGFSHVHVQLITTPTFTTVIEDCGELTNPTNGQVVESPNTLQDSVATYSCSIGFNLFGLATRTCTSTGSAGIWNGTAPTCERMYTSE